MRFFLSAFAIILFILLTGEEEINARHDFTNAFMVVIMALVATMIF